MCSLDIVVAPSAHKLLGQSAPSPLSRCRPVFRCGPLHCCWRTTRAGNGGAEDRRQRRSPPADGKHSWQQSHALVSLLTTQPMGVPCLIHPAYRSNCDEESSSSVRQSVFLVWFNATFSPWDRPQACVRAGRYFPHRSRPSSPDKQCCWSGAAARDSSTSALCLGP